MFVRVRGDFLGEDDWVRDIVYGGPTPESFQAGKTAANFELTLWGKEGEFTMDFSCAEEDVAVFLDGVKAGVEREIEEEGGRVTATRELGPLAFAYEYAGHRFGGEVTAEIVERERDGGDPYRLEITWEHDD